MSEDPTASRKRDHLRLALHADVGFPELETGFDRLHVRPTALPERDLAEVDLTTNAFGAVLRAPLLVSCMTGGVSEAGAVNRALAAAAQHHGVAIGLGSGRVVLDEAASAASFQIRDVAPDVLLLANLGAVELHRYGAADCARLVEACAADVLVLHLNALQEAVQPEGDTRFRGVLGRIEAVCAQLETPVVVKEVGFGLSAADVRRLVEAGVSGVDIAGAGGTSWARLEGLRDSHAHDVAEAFGSWGIPTTRAVADARAALDAMGSSATLLASGGVRHGVDVLKALCLGADIVGMARGLLAGGASGFSAATEALGVVIEQLRVGVWAAGAGSIASLDQGMLI